jgi:hypothetical protein
MPLQPIASKKTLPAILFLYSFATLFCLFSLTLQQYVREFYYTHLSEFVLPVVAGGITPLLFNVSQKWNQRMSKYEKMDAISLIEDGLISR